MAGNTKLIGFGAAGTVELQRWGEKVQVKLELESIKALRAACYERLPKKPPERLGNPDEFDATYDESTGRIVLSLDPTSTKTLAMVLKRELGGSDDMLKKFDAWASDLMDCHQAHLDYINVDEPGVESKK